MRYTITILMITLFSLGATPLFTSCVTASSSLEKRKKKQQRRKKKNPTDCPRLDC